MMQRERLVVFRCDESTREIFSEGHAIFRVLQKKKRHFFAKIRYFTCDLQIDDVDCFPPRETRRRSPIKRRRIYRKARRLGFIIIEGTDGVRICERAATTSRF